jgi:hypothetical protein
MGRFLSVRSCVRIAMPSLAKQSIAEACLARRRMNSRCVAMQVLRRE